MRRWLAVGVTVIVILIVTVIVYGQITKAKREASYQSALRKYSKSFAPGLSRKDVEESLKTSGTGFTRMCCVEEQSAFADSVKIGEENPPWFCGENYVYVALTFAANYVQPQIYKLPQDVNSSRSDPSWLRHDSDKLKA